MSQLNSWLNSRLQSASKSYWKRCYRASYNGWNSETFHRHCDDLGPTVTIIHAHGYTFGGYTDKSWKCMFVTRTTVIYWPRTPNFQILVLLELAPGKQRLHVDTFDQKKNILNWFSTHDMKLYFLTRFTLVQILWAVLVTDFAAHKRTFPQLNHFSLSHIRRFWIRNLI